MTDQEFKRLSRAQLIEIIYQLQLEVEKLDDQKKKLEVAVADKNLRISTVGSIADAALEINDCFRSAQSAAEQYLGEIKKLRESTVTERYRVISEAKAEAAQIVSDAREEAARLVSLAQEEAKTILSGAKDSRTAYDAAIDAILKEYGKRDK